MDPEVLKHLSEQTLKTDNSNELSVIAGKINSVVSSLEFIAEERKALKDTLNDLKNNHGILPKIAKKTAELISDPAKIDALNEASETIDKILELLKTVQK